MNNLDQICTHSWERPSQSLTVPSKDAEYKRLPDLSPPTPTTAPENCLEAGRGVTTATGPSWPAITSSHAPDTDSHTLTVPSKLQVATSSLSTNGDYADD
ncbi:hypothetical protein E2C01_018196 [Portunus trituberculatus]|uniref:Uncharacterized protein n=1 Tax=Portunus trituberculatus TaxID=210409 RepID=A0A5B7DVS3_PORTR|nr:hypothetical protein [Portunus trituberculatus]